MKPEIAETVMREGWHIPIHYSGYGELPKPYGAFIKWEEGQRVRVLATSDPRSKETTGTIRSETRVHDNAPEIAGARGQGRWVREVLCHDDGNLWAISESRLEYLHGSREADDAVARPEGK